MENIIMLSESDIVTLAEATTRAMANGKSIRIVTGTSGVQDSWLKYKVGEGMWSPPMYSIE